MADDKLSDKQQREAIDRFEAVGIGPVQLAVDHPASSPLFGIGDPALACRDLARQWLKGARRRERNRRRRQEALLWIAAFAGIVAAIAGIAAL